MQSVVQVQVSSAVWSRGTCFQCSLEYRYRSPVQLGIQLQLLINVRPTGVQDFFHKGEILLYNKRCLISEKVITALLLKVSG